MFITRFVQELSNERKQKYKCTRYKLNVDMLKMYTNEIGDLDLFF